VRAACRIDSANSYRVLIIMVEEVHHHIPLHPKLFERGEMASSTLPRRAAWWNPCPEAHIFGIGVLTNGRQISKTAARAVLTSVSGPWARCLVWIVDTHGVTVFFGRGEASASRYRWRAQKSMYLLRHFRTKELAHRARPS